MAPAALAAEGCFLSSRLVQSGLLSCSKHGSEASRKTVDMARQVSDLASHVDDLAGGGRKGLRGSRTGSRPKSICRKSVANRLRVDPPSLSNLHKHVYLQHVFVEPPREFEPRTASRDNFPSPCPRGKFGDSNMFRLIQTRADSLRPMELGLTMGPGIGLSELVASLGTTHHRCVDAGGVAQGQDDAPWRRMGIRMLLRGPDVTGLLSARGWPRRCP